MAAISRASIRLHALDGLLRELCHGALDVQCDAVFEKGQELGWFQHGSTILVFAPKSFSIAPGMHEGKVLKMGEALMQLPVESKSV